MSQHVITQLMQTHGMNRCSAWSRNEYDIISTVWSFLHLHCLLSSTDIVACGETLYLKHWDWGWRQLGGGGSPPPPPPPPSYSTVRPHPATLIIYVGFHFGPLGTVHISTTCMQTLQTLQFLALTLHLCMHSS
jgi:hypothetical protein